MSDQINSCELAASLVKRVISVGHPKEPDVQDGPAEILARHETCNAEVGPIGGKCVGGRNKGSLKELQVNMRIRLGELSQSRKEPFVRKDAVHGKANLSFAS
jgi:hypothetical protein